VTDFESGKYLFYAWLAMAIVLGVPAGVIYLRNPSVLQYPPSRKVALTWNGFDVAVAFIAYFTWMLFFGIFSEALFPEHDHRPLVSLAVHLASVPAILATILLLLANTRETKLYQIGLSWNRVPGSFFIAYLFWFFLTPLILVLNGAVDLAYVRLAGVRPTPHPLANVLEGNPSVMAWILVILQAVIAGPVIEELLFRGLLQRWLVATPRGASAVLIAAGCFALFPTHTIDRFWSFAFFLTMVFGYYVISIFSEGGRLAPQAAIYAGSLLFAELHSTVWPTPVPLFFLGAALGYLAYRTRSLIGPIVFHGLFNGVSCLALALLPGHATGEEMNGKPTASARQVSPAISISSLVSDSWCPFRR
jgi:membrane protease YdiL (CAAX protease family)